MAEGQKSYTVEKLKGLPIIGMAIPALSDPLNFMVANRDRGADIVSFRAGSYDIVQINHPDLIRQVLVSNNKNYQKSSGYIRFESAIGKGLLTSNGERWKRDRQSVQPMFNRDRVAGYYFEVASEVSEKYKKKWLQLTEHGPATLNITSEMAKITTEIILKSIFGKEIGDDTVTSLHGSYSVLIDYLKTIRLFPRTDMRKVFRTPFYFRFKRALDNVDATIERLSQQYKSGGFDDKYNMMALLMKAQKENPGHFTAENIRDQSVSMVFAGFESTSIVMQWIWYSLDGHDAVKEKFRQEIASLAPSTSTHNSEDLSFEAVAKMDYSLAVLREAMRLYPPFWHTGREPIEDDYFGDFLVKKGSVVMMPQYAMHRHPKWWKNPDEFMPERFLGTEIDDGLFFPFSQGPRKCSGHLFVEMEARTVMAKLLPLFNVRALNKENNPLVPVVSLKLTHPLMAEITRA